MMTIAELQEVLVKENIDSNEYAINSKTVMGEAGLTIRKEDGKFIVAICERNEERVLKECACEHAAAKEFLEFMSISYENLKKYLV